MLPEILNELIREGDEDALRRIYLHVYNPLLRYGCSIEDDKDLVHDEIQELFIWLLNNPKKLRKISNLEGYLYKSLRRNIRSSAQRLRKATLNSGHFPLNRDTEEPSPELRLIEEETRKMDLNQLNAGIGSLPSHQREVIFLRYYECKSYDEIADIFSVSNQVVRNTVFRAMKNLRKHIAGLKDIPTIGLLISILLLN